jgi:aminopeptidase-like protein
MTPEARAARERSSSRVRAGLRRVSAPARARARSLPEASRSSAGRGLYPGTGGAAAQEEQLAMLWVLNQSDGERSLLAIAERSGLSFDEVRDASDRLAGAGLLADGGPPK